MFNMILVDGMSQEKKNQVCSKEEQSWKVISVTFQKDVNKKRQYLFSQKVKKLHNKT